MKRLIGLILLSVLAVGCGGDNNNTSNLPQSSNNNASNFPQSAADVKFLFDSLPEILSNPLSSGAIQNPDTKITTTIINNDPNQPYLAPIYNITIVYKGKEIYNKANDWGTYLADGSTKSGEYLLLIKEYPAGYYAPISKIFINGELIDLPLQSVIGIKEFDNGWVILLSQVGTIRSGQIISSWSMYNMDTSELREYGEYGLLYSS